MHEAARVEVHDGFLRVIAPEHHADFHLRWLRHNCDRDRHPTTGERMVDSSELPDELAATGARLDGDALEVSWAHDGRVSRYPIAWLWEHAYAIDRLDVPAPSSDVGRIELVPAPGASIASLVPAVLDRVRAEGAVVVRRARAPGAAAPEDETEAWIAALEASGLGLVGTHFGRIEDLRTDNTTNANTDQLGYTDAAIGLHTDQPFLDQPPRYQLLQAIRTAARGGDSLIADGLRAFRYLASRDAEAAALLAGTPVRFHRKQAAFERVVIAPIVRPAGPDGDGFHIRASYFTMAPHRLAFDRMTAWYRAHDRFFRLLRDPRHHQRFRLEPGDVLLYDNHRVLHGRTGFSGPRWVRGVYFDPRRA
jgi:gamma-butyrobetaine dioxygenase/trimethyllysine dioxygenase